MFEISPLLLHGRSFSMTPVFITDSTLSVDINNVPATIFTVIASDPENDGLTYSLTCTSISGAACPFSIDAGLHFIHLTCRQLEST